MREAGEYSEEQLRKAFYEVTKQSNLYEYGKSILKILPANAKNTIKTAKK